MRSWVRNLMNLCGALLGETTFLPLRPIIAQAVYILMKKICHFSLQSVVSGYDLHLIMEIYCKHKLRAP